MLRKLIGLVLALAAVGGIYLLTRSPRTGESSIPVGASAADIQAARAAISADRVLSKLTKNAMVYWRVDGPQFLPAYERVVVFWDKLIATNLAKKYALAEKFNPRTFSVSDIIIQRATSEGNNTEEAAVFSVLSDTWKKLTVTTLVLSNELIAGPDDMKIPVTFVSLEFLPDVKLEPLSKFIDGALEKNKSTLEVSKAKIEKTSSNPDIYKIEVLPPSAEYQSVRALLKVGAADLTLIVGTDDETKFFPQSENDRFINSPKAAAIENSYNPRAAITMFFDGTAVGKYFDELLKAASLKEKDKEFEEAINMIMTSHLVDISLVTYSQAFDGKISSKQCVELPVSAPIANIYQKIIDGRMPLNSEMLAKSVARFVTPKTLFLWRFSGGALQSFGMSVQANYEQLNALNKGATDAKVSSAIDRLATLGKDIDAFFAENDIEEGAIRVESVDSAPIPEVSFYLSSRGRSASELLKSIQSFAEKQVKSVTGQSATSENVKLSVSESNAPVVEMKLFEGLTITAKGEGERTIKLSLVGPMLGVSQSLVDGDAKYFLGLPSLRGLMGESQAIWDVYAYVNMNGVIDSLQTYIPWFLMGQTGAPEDGIHAGDVSEVMALLRSHMLGVQSSYKVRDGLYCFDSYWAILD